MSSRVSTWPAVLGSSIWTCNRTCRRRSPQPRPQPSDRIQDIRAPTTTSCVATASTWCATGSATESVTAWTVPMRRPASPSHPLRMELWSRVPPPPEDVRSLIWICTRTARRRKCPQLPESSRSPSRRQHQRQRRRHSPLSRIGVLRAQDTPSFATTASTSCATRRATMWRIASTVRTRGSAKVGPPRHRNRKTYS